MNDNDAPTRDLFKQLGAEESRVLKDCLEIVTEKGSILWWWCDLTCPTFDSAELSTIAKLRAACLLLDIPWPE